MIRYATTFPSVTIDADVCLVTTRSLSWYAGRPGTNGNTGAGGGSTGGGFTGGGGGGGVVEKVSVYTQRNLGCAGVSFTSTAPWANGTSTPAHLTVVSVQPLAGPPAGGCSTIQ